MRSVLKQVVSNATRPYNIIFPFPVLPTVIGVVSGNILGLWKPVFLTFLFYPANNLWNHINDAEDDFKAGKDTPFIDKRVKKITIVLIAIMYLTSLIFLLVIAVKTITLLLYTILIAITFLYSDNMITKVRLKKHYIGELLVYLTVIPVYILLTDSLLKNINVESIKLITIFTPLMMSTVFIKDLKDVSADKMAGLKTLGVVFNYQTLIKLFFLSLLLYFLTGILLLYDSFFIYAFTPVIIVIYSALKLKRNHWDILSNPEVIRYSIYSGLASLLGIILIGSSPYWLW